MTDQFELETEALPKHTNFCKITLIRQRILAQTSKSSSHFSFNSTVQALPAKAFRQGRIEGLALTTKQEIYIFFSGLNKTKGLKTINVQYLIDNPCTSNRQYPVNKLKTDTNMVKVLAF